MVYIWGTLILGKLDYSAVQRDTFIKLFRKIVGLTRFKLCGFSCGAYLQLCGYEKERVKVDNVCMAMYGYKGLCSYFPGGQHLTTI